MQLRFLGTGGATAHARFNSAVAVDSRLLLDAGAPLIVTLTQAGIEPDGIRYVLLSHCHGDHFAGLGSFLIDRVLSRGPGLVVVGPAGAEQRVDALCRALWGNGWRTMGRGGFDLEHVTIEAGDRVETEHYQIEAVEMPHDNGTYDATASVGYVIDDGQIKLGFTGDAAPGPWVDRLLERSDAAIVECSSPDPGPTHLSHDYVRELATRHPHTRLILTHFVTPPPLIDGTIAAQDLGAVEVSRPVAETDAVVCESTGRSHSS